MRQRSSSGTFAGIGRSAAAAVLIVLLTAAVDAHAASNPANEAAAEALFREGRALLEAGKIEEACPKFLESNRLDPTSGTLLNLGDCYERTGRTASAWGAFVQAEALARRGGDSIRQQEAARRAGDLEGKLSRLTIVVPAALRLPGLHVRCNGETVGEGLWGSAVPVDPGRYTITATAPGRESWTGSTMVRATGATVRIEVPELAAARPESVRVGSLGPEPLSWSTQRTVGLVVGGVGIAGVVVGTVSGVVAVEKNGDLEERCPHGDPRVCDAEGVRLHDGAVMAANVSNVAFAMGGAAVAVGVVLFVTAPMGEPPKSGAGRAATLRVELRARAGPGTTGMVLRGAW